MPSVGWVSLIDPNAQSASRPILFGEDVISGETHVLASREPMGDFLHFDIGQSTQEVLREEYRGPNQIGTLWRWSHNTPYLISRLFQPWLKQTVLAGSDRWPIVDWYSALADWFSESAGIAAYPWPLHYRCALMVTHNVGSDWIFRNKEWFDRICKDERESAARGVWFLSPAKCRSASAIKGIERLRAQGYELGCYGYNGDGRLVRRIGSAEFERRWTTIGRFCDRWRIRGFRGEYLGRCQDLTRRLADRFDYECSVPTFGLGEGCGTEFPFRTSSILSLPISLPLDVDVLRGTVDVKSFWRQQVERARHVASRGGLIVVSIHLRHSANAKAWPLIAQALEEMTNFRGLWITRPCEVFDWWQQQPQAIPSRALP